MTAAKKLSTDIKVFNLPSVVNAGIMDAIIIELERLTDTNQVKFDFSVVTHIKDDCVDKFNHLKKITLQKKISLESVNISHQILEVLTSHGVHTVLNYTKPVPKTTKIDVTFVTPFITGTIHTLKVQVGIEAKSGAPSIKPENYPSGDIIGVVSLISQSFVGSISLCFPKQTFLNICNQLFQEENTEITSEIQDAAGELLNMIYGTAKTEINKNPQNAIQKALPTVIAGKDLKLKQTRGPTIILPFESSAGHFHLEIEATQD